MNKSIKILGIALMIIGLIILGFVISSHDRSQPISTAELGTLGLVVILNLIGFAAVAGQLPNKIIYQGITIDLSPKPPPIPVEPKTLTKWEESDRRKYAANQPTPGGMAGELNVLTDFGEMPSLEIMPQANPMVPMYLLDKHFRILDWNDALNLAFDRTMEGQRNKNALEWVMFMENFREVYDHGVKQFSNGQKHPVIDVEELRYKSERYGLVKATKRAYQVPDDCGEYAGWLVILDPHFETDELAIQYQNDLIEVLRKSLVWSEYAVYYDAVLTNTTIYPELISVILGEQALSTNHVHRGLNAVAKRFGVIFGEPRESGANHKLTPIPDRARVLDLGAGTGNVTIRLAEPGKSRVVVAVENNRAMLKRLKTRCAARLRGDDQEPGVLAIRQDICSLSGFNGYYFDYAIMNNVLYSVDDPSPVLREVNRVLKLGGELRLSGPKKQTDLDKLFRRIKSDLVAAGKFEKLAKDYEHVEMINKLMLSSVIYRWDIQGVKQMIVDAGFEVEWETEDAYEGQAMIVAARKVRNVDA